ncbi:MAG: hypothetical protein LBR95_07865 [Azoarcus sp.]|jgi:hypothetical protein|nr:hypothetical protein [Azoarcus sp.]
MLPPLHSCSVIPFRRNANCLPVLANENEVMNQSAVATSNPVNRSTRHFKSIAVLSLFVLHQEIAMANTKTTGSKAATSASKTLQSKVTGAASKTAGGSALSQTGALKKQTSSSAASAASKVLRDGRTSAQSKSAAGSALAQAKGKK